MARRIFIPICVLILASLACNASLPQVEPTQAPPPTIAIEPTSTIQVLDQPGLPQTEADVPRISVDEAKAALNSGAAVIMDVRSPEAYVQNHIMGAISVPLAKIEQDPVAAYPHKDEWIITYCT